MDSFEINKIVAAVLLAGLIAMVAGFVSRTLVHQDVPAVTAYTVKGVGQPVPAAAPKEEPARDPIAPLLVAASAEKGKAVARKCTACHSFEQGGANKVGPNLYNTVGSGKANIEGFKYSNALAKMGGVWGYEELNAFLANPRKYVPGTRMSFAGLRKASERANLIKYLMSVTDNPPPVPGS